MSFNPIDPDEQPNSVPMDVVVSVRIMTYNHAPYIAQAIESVLMQRTDFPYEILIGEDDSSDGTREICKQYAARYPDRIRLFLRSEKDKIYINGRKTGKVNGRKTQAACRGKYVAVLEGDDFWIDSEKLQKQYDFMEKHQSCVMCVTRCLFWHPRGGRPAVLPWPRYGAFIDRRSQFMIGSYGHTSTFFMRAEFSRSRPAWMSEVIQGDLALQLYAGGIQGGMYALPDITSVYRITGSGIWSQAARKDLQLPWLTFWEKFTHYAREIGDPVGTRFGARQLSFAKYRLRYGFSAPRWLYAIGVIVFHPAIAYVYVKGYLLRKFGAAM